MTRNTNYSLLALVAIAGAAHAQPIVVNTLEDVYDTGTAATVADLPGPDGVISMREATYAANNTPGPHTIEFAIPTAEFYLDTAIALLRLEDGPWVFTADDITIDFASQAQNIGDTNPDGPEVGIYGWEVNGWGHPALYIYGDNCTVRGLGKVYSRATSIQIIGSHNKVVGCKTLGVEIDQGWQGPPATFNVVGGTEPGDANDLGFVDILSWADDNTVVGNRVTTVLVAGSPFSTFPKRNRIGGPTEAERNVINGFGSRSGEGFPTGQGVLVNFAEDTLIQNNYIGVDETGTQRVVQIGPSGIEVRDSIDTTILNNLIAGIWVEGSNHSAGQTFGAGIRVGAVNRDNEGVVIHGNTIGADHTGKNRIQTLNGIIVSQSTGLYSPHDTNIGGTDPAQANLVAFCDRVGVAIGPLVEDATISGNSIHSNASLGIDLSTWAGYDGVTPNDPGDSDTQGGNALQNFPVLSSATSAGGQVLVSGTLDSHPSMMYRIEFFANTDCDPSGHGQGRDVLGFIDVTTDASGLATFDAVLSAAVSPGQVITTTATDLLAAATSEFSACVPVVPSACPADLAEPQGQLDFSDVVAFLTAFSNMDPAADFATPIGQFDFSDVVAFLTAFGAGCP